MAALLLTVAGQAAFGPFGALAGGLIGSFIDRQIFKPSPVQQEGPRLTDLHVTSSSEGAAIARLYGRMRVSPQLIWATNLREVVKTTTQSSGGKGGGGGGSVTTTTFEYFCSFALGLAEGAIQDIGAVWADGKPLDLSKFTTRLYKGTEAQEADPKIAAVEGAENTPAFRGLAYLVFEEMPLEKFGNRIPQLTVEVIRQPAATGVRIEDILRGVDMIPTLGEFAYATDAVFRDDGFGNTVPENQHGSSGKANLLVSLDQLQSAAPNVDTVALIVGWHGTDLRCEQCEMRPKVEVAGKTTTPWSWFAGGISRAAALVVSTDELGALQGGAPSDRSVVQAIEELTDRGFSVLFYPFVIVDIDETNALPNPYSDNAAGVGQAVFPWRGRITISPAIGFAGSPDKTATAATQVAAFFGTSEPGDFGSFNGDTIPYSGPDEWSYRRFVLHCAKLCEQAGGVDAFLIGSEMVQLNAARSDADTFPAVQHWIDLAADVRTILGVGTEISYAANWDEAINYRPTDGSDDVFFNLDPLWADANIDFVGIDNYQPISDWRDGRQHLDAEAGAASIYDIDYLQSQIEGGELYDYFYESFEDRESQTRTPIADAVYGEPWVHRYKDLRSWWLNEHHNRPGGVRDVATTAWAPESKPIWFTEFGCPAIDKGSNQPNVFFDPESSESALPFFSNGRRDDLIQRAYFEAIIRYWDPAEGNNPLSGIYAGRMIDTARMYAWNWDGRPYPQFPSNSLVWRDTQKYRRGHWLTGRLNLVPLADVVAEIAGGLGVDLLTGELSGIVRGYLLDGVMSPRAALAPLMQVHFFDAVETGGAIKFVPRGGPVARQFTADELVDGGDQNGFYRLTRAQETDLPRTAHLKFTDPDSDYRVSDVYSRRLKGSTDKTIELAPPIALDFGEAQGIVDNLLVDRHVMRERAELVLPPSAFALEPTDVVVLDLNGRFFEMRLEDIGFLHTRPARLARTDAATYGIADGAAPTRPPTPVSEAGPVVLHVMDLPILEPTEVPGVPRLAAYAAPWARCAVFRSPIDVGFVLDQLVLNRSAIGVTTADFASGPTAVWDDGNELLVQIPPTEALQSLDETLVLAGGNACAVRNVDGEWEVVQFADAEQTSPTTYKLTRLLRGQLGSEYAMRDPVAAGAPFVMLTSDALQSSIAVSERGNPWNFRWGPSNKPIDDDVYRETAFTPANVGLRPYSPVQLAGDRHAPGANDWTLSWVRRTRIGGDNWEGADVPLGEESELYDVEILDPGDESVVRTTRVSSPSFVYTEAMQTTDLGGAQTSILFRVYQVSIGYGRGTPKQAEVI
ncbi:MAG: glycoside hydrolase/phage tail family protein [Xanthobacteraceae bacterium]